MKWFKNLKAHFPAARTELAQVDTPPIDHRWAALGSNQIICDCCGVDFCDLLSIGYAAPEDWPHAADTENHHTVDLNGGDFLTQDLCRLGDRRFIRCVLTLPLVGHEAPFLIGVWVEVSESDFLNFVREMPDGRQGSMVMMFCTLANIVPPFRAKLPCVMQPRNDFHRPVVHVAIEEDPLYAAQFDGLDFDQLLQILGAHGHFTTNTA